MSRRMILTAAILMSLGGALAPATAAAHAPPAHLQETPSLWEAWEIMSGPKELDPPEVIAEVVEASFVEPREWVFEGIMMTASFFQLTDWAEHVPGALAHLFVAPQKPRRKRVRISSHFGPRFHPVLKRWRLHNGTDFAAPTGTPVRSAAQGIVTYAGWSGASGKLVKVDHLNGYTSSYAHLSKIRPDLRVGDPVAPGSKLGAVGTTGRSTGPHLHFVIKRHGQAVDPMTVQGFEYTSPIKALAQTLHHQRRVMPLLAAMGLADTAAM